MSAKLFGSGTATGAIGPYKLGARLDSRSGIARYLGRSVDHDGWLIVELFAPPTDETESDDTLRRERLAVLAARSHDALPTIHGYGVFGGRTFLASEPISGERLAKLIEDGISHRPCVRAILSAGRALAQLHSCGLTHDRFSGRNVSLTESGRPVVRGSSWGLRKGSEDELADVRAWLRLVRSALSIELDIPRPPLDAPAGAAMRCVADELEERTATWVDSVKRRLLGR